MKHPKTYHSTEIQTENETIFIHGPLSSEELSTYDFHEGLDAFRPPKKQFEAIQQIAEFEEGRINVASVNQQIVGYVTFLYPDPLERWSTFQMEDLLELGAIEVAPDYRGHKVGSTLLNMSMMDEAMENYIIITTEYYWHWDLKGTGLNVWQYREIMQKMMAAGGLEPYATDDPEIVSHPANCLLARIGKNVPQESIDKFHELRFLGRKRNRY
ncbi:acetoin utilization protein AcuA [Melghiribacillus thermohalophilus]|uniref:Acetoin utilization protein AcuA n=1 Tax=Melghiribacillus thermohalophilus TaxID=1324956 RepID=A0A4V2V153_9BACI|nr:GNAT family N-acetyltransferase [Melghiribacillus thermohalophilus]TCT19892.1 acetoin utilization protein AcuA [Melghiribacillus thermohalophilus]